jgi:signal transduction histidine kinase/CheY-like chemotaxis protein
MQEQRRIGPEARAYRRRDGSIVQLEVTAAPIQDESTGGRIAVTAFQDVTAKLLAEEQARQRVAAALAEKTEAEAALMRAQRLDALGRLTGGVAHDFNNLLTVVIGALDVILRHPENAARRQRLGEAALVAARRGQRLTAQLLAFARQQPLQPETRELNELIRQSEPLLRRALIDRVVLTLRLCDDRIVARIDPAQFEATLLNLVVNAVDASADGGEIALETQLCTLSAGEVAGLGAGRYLCMMVADGGQGMSADVLKRIFEPFFTTKPAGKGTGLGLSQVYGFVKQSGGEIEVESEQGAGTRFRIFLPIIAAEPDQLDAEAIGQPGAMPPLRILLVEDDPSVAAVTEAMLVDFGHEVHRAANAYEALRVLWSETELDVLFSDVVMPGSMNGVDLAKQAVAQRPALKVLLTSGFAGESLDEWLSQGAWPFLRKPFLSTELAEVLAGLDCGPHEPGTRTAEDGSRQI